MEAKRYEEINSGRTGPQRINPAQPAVRPTIMSQYESRSPLTQAYQTSQKASSSRHSQKRELSFFLHVSSYCLIFGLLYPFLSAALPFILSFPLAVFLPIVVIIAIKKGFQVLLKK